jgi:hypothetical protein
VRALVAGEQWFSVRGFDLNTAMLTADGRAKVADIADKLRSNPEMNIVFSLTPDVDQAAAEKARLDAEYHKAHDAWVKASKKAKKGTFTDPEPMPPSTVTDPNDKLLDDRIAAIKALMTDVKNADLRVSFKKLPLPAASVAAAAPAAPAATTTGKKGSKSKGSKAPTATPAAPAAQQHMTLTANTGAVKKLFDN